MWRKKKFLNCRSSILNSKWNYLFDIYDPISKGVFVWRWNRVDGKLWKENEKKKFFRVYLVGWRGRKINSGAQVFSPWPRPKYFLSKIERKVRGGLIFSGMTKMPMCMSTWTSSSCSLSLSLSFSLSLGQ